MGCRAGSAGFVTLLIVDRRRGGIRIEVTICDVALDNYRVRCPCFQRYEDICVGSLRERERRGLTHEICRSAANAILVVDRTILAFKHLCKLVACPTHIPTNKPDNASAPFIHVRAVYQRREMDGRRMNEWMNDEEITYAVPCFVSARGRMRPAAL